MMDKEILTEKISIEKVSFNKKGNPREYSLKEDNVNDKTSARMIVNYLIKKFDLRY